MVTQEFKCLNCEKQIKEDIDLCDDCFEKMPMDNWIVAGSWE